MTSNMKREKFIELAEKRASSALKYLRLLGNLTNKQSYEYKPEEFQQIIDSMTAEIKRLQDKVNGTLEKKQEFRFKEAA